MVIGKQGALSMMGYEGLDDTIEEPRTICALNELVKGARCWRPVLARGVIPRVRGC